MTQSAPLVIDAERISKVFTQGERRVDAVHAVSLSLRAGEFVALSGPSGCGKSTLLTILGLVETPTSGLLRLDGEDISSASHRVLRDLRREKVGFVFQAFNLLSTLTALENVMIPLILTTGSRAESEARARRLLSDLGMEHRASALPATLSGGEAQRVAIARAVAHRPRYILADEPTGNLDSVAGARVLALLKDIAGQGTAVLMATHSAEALRYCSRTLRMRDGELLE
jgi:putative ABC transport system ATP-binding protein